MALPAAYQDEVNAPASTFRDAAVYLAEIDSTPVGIAVVKHVDDATEIKRLWAQPEARGRGVGSALLDTITSHHGGPIRLTVWDWRADAIRMYRSRGFALVTPWDERPRLVCMERMP
nr:GNAT family N-acetyltransferase [Microbacterium endophyticum]